MYVLRCSRSRLYPQACDHQLVNYGLFYHSSHHAGSASSDVTVQISGTDAGLHADFIQHVPKPDCAALPAVWYGRPRQVLTPKSEQLPSDKQQ